MNAAIDGQQRITSVFGVFQTDIQPDPDDDDSWTHIYFDILADRDAQDSQMFAFTPGDASLDPKRHFPLKVMFDTVAYRRATRDLSDELAEKVDRIQTVFKEARIPAQVVDTDDKTTVAIVFERINRRGVPLDTLQLLTAWTWSEDFHLQQKFEELNEELTPFGFKDVGEENNLLLRCCAAVLARNASTETLIKLNGTAVREQFDKVVNGIKGAIDFLQTNLQVYTLSNLPYSSMLIPLSVFFAIPGNNQFHYDDEQRNTIIRWFWRVCFAKRYNSQPIKSIQSDLVEMIRLREHRKSELGEFSCNVTSEFFKKEVFRINNVSTKTFVLLVAQHNPRSFISGSPIRLREVLKEYNRNEFRHLYPKAYQKKTIRLFTILIVWLI